jgi:hypothetical protein
MSTTINQTIAGIVYQNVQHVDITKQPHCPLEGTVYEAHCQNEYHNVQLRDDSPCVHSSKCAELLKP